jgi:glutathione peroxidase
MTSVFILLPFMMMVSAGNFHEYTVKDIKGEDLPLSTYEGKVVLIVNTASRCGFTPQYDGLQALHEKYKDQGFTVLGAPANNFGGQEPGSNEEIVQFCKTNYSVSFPMLSKLSVKGGDQHPLFSYLTTEENPDFTGDIKWNFEKFLISKDGKVVRRFRSRTKPLSKELTAAIEAELAK